MTAWENLPQSARERYQEVKEKHGDIDIGPTGEVECPECGHDSWILWEDECLPSNERRYAHHDAMFECLICGHEAYHVWDSRLETGGRMYWVGADPVGDSA